MGTQEENQVRAWGFHHVFTWSDGPVRPIGSGPGGWRHGRLFNSCARRRGFHYAPHSHASLTTHLIVAGELTLWYPNETSQQRVTYGPGSRVDVEAGRVHEVWVGDEGCTYVIGEC
ncbi:unnamed protein product [Clonostachys rhizophaga]|uniref:Uncharacterized protein n=1 Tax=Clonostachys rhizophaga TaxID=160324 RepID=A0A9N9YF56_9HYPO|nr:unnamed protein product [Clonostachys rhizophaga]